MHIVPGRCSTIDGGRHCHSQAALCAWTIWIMEGSRLRYPLAHCHISAVQWAVVSFNSLPHCKGAVGSSILQCTAPMQGGAMGRGIL